MFSSLERVLMPGRTCYSSGEEQRQADLALMERVRLGDARGFDALVQTYWAPLVGYAAQLLGSADPAEDIVQETFIRVWERRAEWKSTGSVRGYLYCIARNCALNERRSRHVRSTWLERYFSREDAGGQTPLDAAEEEEMQVALHRLVDALPERRRQVFILARFHCLSYREIAEVMGISTQTVANQMSSAVAHLRQALSQFLARTA